MEKGYRICKICGKKYEYCKTLRPGVYRWQDVACCKEHAAMYFERIAKSRAKNTEEEVPTVTASEEKTETEMESEVATENEEVAVETEAEATDNETNELEPKQSRKYYRKRK